MKVQVIFLPDQPKSRSFQPSAKAVAICRGLVSYFYLSPEQCNKLYWRGNNLTTAHALLKSLADHGFVEAVSLKRSTDPRGRQAYIYRLGTQGRKYLRSIHAPVPDRLRHTDWPKREHLSHLLALNDVVINGSLLSRDQQIVVLAEWQHDRSLKKRPFPVALHNGKLAHLIPDAVLRFELNDTDAAIPDDQYVCLELDLGASRDYWTEKCEKYLPFPGVFMERYNTESFTLAVVTPAGETHMKNLRLWTQQVFRQHGKADSALANNVFFTHLPAERTPPETFWLAKVWLPLFADTRMSLLEVQNV